MSHIQVESLSANSNVWKKPQTWKNVQNKVCSKCVWLSWIVCLKLVFRKSWSRVTIYMAPATNIRTKTTVDARSHGSNISSESEFVTIGVLTESSHSETKGLHCVFLQICAITRLSDSFAVQDSTLILSSLHVLIPKNASVAREWRVTIKRRLVVSNETSNSAITEVETPLSEPKTSVPNKSNENWIFCSGRLVWITEPAKVFKSVISTLCASCVTDIETSVISQNPTL